MKYKVYITRNVDKKEVQALFLKAKEYLYPIPLEFSDIQEIPEKDNDKDLYQTDWSASIKNLQMVKSVKYSFLASMPHEEYNGVILFLNKKKAIESSTLYGQHTWYKGKSYIQVYTSDRYVNLVKKDDTYYEDYISNPSIARWEADPHAFIHELMHAISWEFGLEDKLHEYIARNDFDAYKGYLLSKLPAKPTAPNDLLPIVKARSDVLMARMEALKLPIRITEGFRTFARQNDLYAQGRTRPGVIVTNAKAGESMHNYGIAFDICFRGTEPYPKLTDPRWQTVYDEAEKLGFQCYGRLLKWDYPHIQFLNGYVENDFKKGLVDYIHFG